MAEYTKKIGIPQFEPSGNNVELNECIDVDKYVELLTDIEEALKNNKISETEAKFLKLGASRWIKFNYAKIADYYVSKGNEDLQRLMEKMALVLIDVDNALSIEVVKCKEFINNIRKEWEVKNNFKEGQETSDETNIDELF